MIKTPACSFTTKRISDGPTSTPMTTSNARRHQEVAASIKIVSLPITKYNSSIIQVVTKANFVKNITSLEKMPPIPMMKPLLSLSVPTASFVPLLTTKIKYLSNLSISGPKI